MKTIVKWLPILALLCALQIAAGAQAVLVPTSGFGSVVGSKRDYHAKGDALVFTNCSTASGSATLTASSASFTASMVGKTVGIPYAGTVATTIGQTLVTTISSYTDSTHVTMAATASVTIVGARTVTDAGISKNGTTLTSATAAFTAGDIGKTIVIPGAGDLVSNSGGSPETTKIVALISSTQVTVANASEATVSAQTVTIPGAWAEIGTDDTAALTNACAAAETAKCGLTLEPGRYLITSAIPGASNLHITGSGSGQSIISPVGHAYSVIYYIGGQTAANALTDLSFDNVELDGSGMCNNAYTTNCKALYCNPVIRLRVAGCYVHDFPATGIGCDFVPYAQIVNNNVFRCGRQVPEYGGGAGGSGIGIGTGLWTYEPVTISGNHCDYNGNHGIFVESQSSNVRSQGIRITGNYCARNGGNGIGDHATDGTIISGNVCAYNTDGIRADAGFVNTLYSQNGQIVNNVCQYNNNGITLVYKDGPFQISENSCYFNAGIGINISPATGGSLTGLAITSNNICGSATFPCPRGIWVQTGTWDHLSIERNRIWDCGISNGSQRPAIVTAVTIADLYVKDNICWDDRAGGSKTQSYGFQATAGTITQLVLDNNDFAGNGTGTSDVTGASVTTTVTHFNP